MAMNAPPPTVGDLLPEDDLMHPVGAHPQHNESMFFNFFDTEREVGGFVRIGNRPNEGHAEMTLCLFVENRGVAFQWGRPEIAVNDHFDTAGMAFKVVTPGRHLRITYGGRAVWLQDPYEMHSPGPAFRSNPWTDVELELDQLGLGPMIGDRTGTDLDDAVIYLEGVGHYQQHMWGQGRLRLGDEEISLATRGVRDHSWGPRIWQSLYKDRSIWCSFGEELSFIACKTWHTPNEAPAEMGCIVEHGEVTSLEGIQIRTRCEANGYYHKGLDMWLTTCDGREIPVSGEVINYIPLRHQKPGHDKVHLGQAMTRFRSQGRYAVGLSEYFDAMRSITGRMFE